MIRMKILLSILLFTTALVMMVYALADGYPPTQNSQTHNSQKAVGRP